MSDQPSFDALKTERIRLQEIEREFLDAKSVEARADVLKKHGFFKMASGVDTKGWLGP